MAARISVIVTPKSARDEVVGRRGGDVIVRVTVAPEGGKANARVEKVLSAALSVPKTSVAVAKGATARHKVIEFATLDQAHADAWVAALPFL